METGKAFPFTPVHLTKPLTASAPPATAKAVPRIRIHAAYSLEGRSPPCVFHFSVTVHSLTGGTNSNAQSDQAQNKSSNQFLFHDS